MVEKATAAGAAEELPRSTPPSFPPHYLSGRACHSVHFILAPENGRTGFPSAHPQQRVGWFPSQYHHWLDSQVMGPNTVHAILLGQVILLQMPRHLQLAAAPLGPKIVRAELDHTSSSVNQHLGDDDPRGPIFPLLDHQGACYGLRRGSLVPGFQTLTGPGE